MFSDEKDVVVSTYKVKIEGTYDGKDASGIYNAGTVWKQENGKWMAIFHTNVKPSRSAAEEAASVLACFRRLVHRASHSQVCRASRGLNASNFLVDFQRPALFFSSYCGGAAMAERSDWTTP